MISFQDRGYPPGSDKIGLGLIAKPQVSGGKISCRHFAESPSMSGYAAATGSLCFVFRDCDSGGFWYGLTKSVPFHRHHVQGAAKIGQNGS